MASASPLAKREPVRLVTDPRDFAKCPCWVCDSAAANPVALLRPVAVEGCPHVVRVGDPLSRWLELPVHWLPALLAGFRRVGEAGTTDWLVDPCVLPPPCWPWL